MKIIVKTPEHTIRLGLPTSLIFSKGSAFLAEKLGRKYSPESMVNIPEEAIPKLCAELRRIKKKYGVYELVEVESADGEYVQIIL